MTSINDPLLHLPLYNPTSTTHHDPIIDPFPDNHDIQTQTPLSSDVPDSQFPTSSPSPPSHFPPSFDNDSTMPSTRNPSPASTNALPNPSPTQPPNETTPLISEKPQKNPPPPNPSPSSSGQVTNSASSASQPSISFRKTLTFCLPFIIPDSPFLRLIGVASIFSIIAYKACILVPGLSMKIIVDALSSPDADVRHRVPILGVFLFLAGRVAYALFGQAQEVSQEYCSQHMARRFATKSFAHLQSLSLAYHTRKRTGEVTSILGRGTNAVTLLLRHIVFSLTPTIIEAFVVSSIFFHLGSPMIALTTVATVAVYISYTAYITKWRVRINRDLRTAQNNASSRATETILHYSTVKSFGMDDEEVRRYDSLWEVVQRTAFRAKGIITAFNVSSNFIVQFGTFLGMLIAAGEAGRGRITAGDFILVQAYIGQLFGPLIWMGNSYGQVVGALTNIEEVMQLFDTLPEVVDEPDAVDVTGADAAGCDIEFRGVSFLYEEGEGGGVVDVSFRVPAGRMVALVGMSGAGKSTIVKLLLRLYDVQQGKILLGGRDIRSLKQGSLRHVIGLVAQETVLFNDTLRRNISYGRPEATDAQIWNAVHLASLTPFVTAQTEGLETNVGEQGMRLSGGERQRVGIARAVIKDPAVMVLDESTSALSTIDEREIQRNLHAVCENRTTLAIAHRLSTIMMADEILVFEKGRIVERGTHTQLAAKDGTYARMWKAQAGEE